MFDEQQIEEAAANAAGISIETNLQSVREMLQALLNNEDLFRLTAEVNLKTMKTLMEVGFSREEAVQITASQGSNLV